MLIALALYVRLNIAESPVFTEEKARELVPKAPLAELLRLQGREVVLVAGSILGALGFIYMAHTYLAMYAHSHLGYSRNFIWLVGALGGVASMTFMALSAILSDRLGRRRIMLVGWAACLAWSFMIMPLLNTGKPMWYAVAIVGMCIAAAIGSGPTAAFIPELFATRYRYSGSALAQNLAGIVGSASPPLIAGTLLAIYGSWAIGLMLGVLTFVSLVCTYLLPETNGTALGPSVADVRPELERPARGPQLSWRAGPR